MDKEERIRIKRLIAELYTSNSSMTHTDDWRKMREAAECIQSLLSACDALADRLAEISLQSPLDVLESNNKGPDG